MKHLLIALLIAQLGLDAIAQLPDGLAECRGIEDGLLRLRCYDDFVEGAKGAAPPSADAPPERQVGRWTIRELVNPLDDTTTVIAAVPATQSDGQQLPGNVELYIRCQSGKTEAFLSWLSVVGHSAMVTFRIGDQEPDSRAWVISSDMKSTFYPGSAIAFLAKLSTSSRLAAEVRPRFGSRVTAVFDLEGAAQAVTAVRSACGW